MNEFNRYQKALLTILSLILWGLFIWVLSLLGFGSSQDPSGINQDDYYDSRIK